MKSIGIKYTCKKCEEDFYINVTLPTPAQTYGPPEKCYPEEPGDCDPPECEECGEEVVYPVAMELAREYVEALDEERWERRLDEMRENN